MKKTICMLMLLTASNAGQALKPEPPAPPAATAALAQPAKTPASKSEPNPAAAPVAGSPDDHAQRSRDLGAAELVSPPSAAGKARAPGGLPTGKGKVPLTNTYWKLVEIEGSVIQSRDGMAESHMRLIDGSDRFIGQGICNRVGGAFKLAGRKLSFDVTDSMPMPCWADGPPETTLTDALRSTVRYQIDGNDLYLIDEDGARRAHYQALLRPQERIKAGL